MTGPTGDQPRGIWEILEVNPPRSLFFRDLFADDDGNPNPEMPGATARVAIEDIGAGRTRMSIQSAFPSPEAMEQVLAMGTEEGLSQAVGQIDAILEETAAVKGSSSMTRQPRPPKQSLTPSTSRGRAHL